MQWVVVGKLEKLTMDKIEALNAIDHQQDTDSLVLPPVLPAVRVQDEGSDNAQGEPSKGGLQ